MPPAPKTTGVQLGGTAHRLAVRYATAFLMPPGHRSYVAPDAGSRARRTYREYDIATGGVVRTLLGPDQFGDVSRPSADGTRIAVKLADGVRVIDLAAGRTLLTVPLDNDWDDPRFSLSPSGGRLAVLERNPETHQREADHDMEDVYISAVFVYDVAGKDGPWEFRPLANFWVHASLSPDGRLLAASGHWEEERDGQAPPFDGTDVIQVWDIDSGAEVIRHIPPNGQRGHSVAFGGGLMLVNAPDTGPAALFDLSTGESVREYAPRPPRLEQAVLSPDGKVIAGVLSSGELVRRNARTWRKVSGTPCPFRVPRNSSLGYDEYTRDIAFREDGTAVVLRVVDQSVEVWSAPDGEQLTSSVGGTAPITAMRFSDDRKEVRTAGRGDTVVRRWNAETGELLAEDVLPEEVARCCIGRVWLGPSDRLVAQSREGKAVYHLTTGDVRITPPVYQQATLGETLSADGWRVSLPTHYLNEGDVGLRVEHIVEGKEREVYRFDSTWAAASYDRGRVVLTYDDREEKQRTVVCLKVDSGETEEVWSRTMPVGAQFGYGSGMDTAVLWSLDGASVMVISRREKVPVVFDSATGETSATWATRLTGPHAVHPSRPILATALAEGDGVVLADWRTGEALASIPEVRSPKALAWSPDGAKLAVSSADGTAWVFAPALG